MKNSIKYKDTYAAKGSQLHAALTEGDATKAKQIYNETTERMKALTPNKEKQDASV